MHEMPPLLGCRTVVGVAVWWFVVCVHVVALILRYVDTIDDR